MNRSGSQDESLNPRTLLSAYAMGYFPMAEPETGEVNWYSPDPRGHLPLDAFRVSDSLARTVRRGVFEVRADTTFEEVMRQCAKPRPGQPETWISEAIVAAYTELHRRGWAHSVEAWRGGQLVGGLYGVSIHGAFFGESMFSRPEIGGTDSSKVCLVALVEHLRTRGYSLLDTQFVNAHLEQFGCVAIARDDYMQRVDAALRQRDVSWGVWNSPDRAGTDRGIER